VVERQLQHREGAAGQSRLSVWMKRENNSPCELMRSFE
jgi:hypothetical protein